MTRTSQGGKLLGTRPVKEEAHLIPGLLKLLGQHEGVHKSPQALVGFRACQNQDGYLAHTHHL